MRDIGKMWVAAVVYILLTFGVLIILTAMGKI